MNVPNIPNVVSALGVIETNFLAWGQDIRSNNMPTINHIIIMAMKPCAIGSDQSPS